MKMPPEWTRHDRTWMAWPGPGYLFGTSEADADEARATWAAVANATVDFEPVTILVPTSELAHAKRALSGRVEIVEAELNDAWMRDIGPTFAFDGDELVAINWVFNGWGAQEWATWDKDARIGRRVAELAGVRVVDSPLVNEGGGIHVNGEGQVLATRTVQLDQGRNPGWSPERVEAEFAEKLGAEQRDQLWGHRDALPGASDIDDPFALVERLQGGAGEPDELDNDLARLLGDPSSFGDAPAGGDTSDKGPDTPPNA
jgi:agmatine deiminase